MSKDITAENQGQNQVNVQRWKLKKKKTLICHLIGGTNWWCASKYTLTKLNSILLGIDFEHSMTYFVTVDWKY